MIFSYDIEKKVLAGLIQHPNKWEEFALLLEDDDFYSEHSKAHISIFKLIKFSYNKGENVDETILFEKIKQLGVTFPDGIDVGEYLTSLCYFKVNAEVFESCVIELKKISVRRVLYESCKNIANFAKKAPPTLSYQELLDKADNLYNTNLQKFEGAHSGPVDLFAKMEEVVEERGNNPQEEFGYMGPHQRMNEIYGSILRAGNISVIVARSGVGKTSWTMDFSTYVGAKEGIPILHFDNGEMSEEELIFRQCSAMSGVPMWLLESGKWRTHRYGNWDAEEVVRRVRLAFKKLKEGNGIKFYYENVAGLTPYQMCSLLKRIYYSKIGRGNPLIFSFDYIKSDFSNTGKDNGWLQVGCMVDKFKQTIHRELAFDNKPCVAMLTSVQSNRLGITTNRGADAIVDDESVVSLSDNITQFCSHLFLLRQKVVEEIAEEGERFGSHKLICLKARHLGRDALRHINPVNMPDGQKKRNFINLEFKNFSVTERGDLQDIVDSMNNHDVDIDPMPEEDSDLPPILRR